MTLSTRAGFRWVAPLAVAGALAGCQSSRMAFQFAPAAPYATAPQPVAAPVPAAAPAPIAPVLRPVASLPAPLRRVARRLTARPLPTPLQLPAVAVTPASILAAPTEATATRPHRHHTAPAHIQESGLKRIFFFFLAVLLAVLAGLGALVSLIPGVSFWGGVGLAAAGLVVLFLLYRLLSGGGKKKK